MSSPPNADISKVKFPEGSKLSETQVNFMRLIEKQNLERVQRLKTTNRNNIITGLSLGGTVLAIYFYSMFSVKQEKFLDDFEEPKKIQSQ